MYDIISIGSATRDMFCIGVPFVKQESEKFKTLSGLCLPYGSKVEIPNIIFTTGGAGTNAAVTFARMGLSTACISRVGNDPGGLAIRNELQREGVDEQFFQIDKEKLTAYSIIFLTKEGERTILSYKGAGDKLSEKEIPWDKIKETKWLYLNSLGGNKELLWQLLEFGKKNNIKIASNPGMRELRILKENKIWLENYDIFTLNQEEASDLTGVDYENEKEIFAEMDRLVDGIVAMTKGHDGVVVSDGKKRYKAGVFPEKLVDRTGAGDAFASGFVASYIKTRNIKESIKLGSANGTSVIEYIGAKEGILKKDQYYNNERWKNFEIDCIIT